MSFLWLIRHNVWSKKARSVLTAIAIAIGVMAVVALGIVTHSVRATAAGVLEVGKADFTVAQRNVSDILESALTEQQLARVRAVPGVASAVGVLLDTERLDAQHPLVVQIGIAPQDLTPFGVLMVAGRPFGASAAGEMLVGSHLAQDLDVQLGQRINIAGGPKTVVGIFATGNVFGDSAVMFPLVPFQAHERQPGGLSLFFVKTDRGASIATVERRVEHSSPVLAAIRNLTEWRSPSVPSSWPTPCCSRWSSANASSASCEPRVVPPPRRRSRARRGVDHQPRRRRRRRRARLRADPHPGPAPRPRRHPRTDLYRRCLRPGTDHRGRGTTRANGPRRANGPPERRCL